MKPAVKKRVRQYGIPIDLVILATGVALLFPAINGPAVVLLYLLAVVASAFRLGWRSGLTAMAAAVVMMIFVYGDQVRASHELTLILLSLVAVGTDEWRRRGFANPATIPELRDFGGTAATQWESIREQLDRGTSRMASGWRDLSSAADRRWTSLKSDVAARIEARRKAKEETAFNEEPYYRREPEPPRPVSFAPPPLPEPTPQPIVAPPPIVEPPPEIFRPPAAAEEPQPRMISAEPPPAPAQLELPSPVEGRPDLDDTLRDFPSESFQDRLAEQRKEVAAEMNLERQELERRLEENRLMLERAEADRAERERIDAERATAVRNAAQRLAAERQERQRLEREREELARKLEQERQAGEKAAAERAQEAKREAEKTLEERLATERAAMQKKYDEKLRTELEKVSKAAGPAKPSLFATMLSWLKTPQHSKPAVNLNTKKVSANSTAPRRPAASTSTTPRPVRPSSQRERRPRILMLERRRQMADTMAPKLKAQGVDVEIVERWIDAVDELFRFRPDAIFVDAEVPDFPRVHQSIIEQSPRLPMFVTTGSYGALPNLPRAAAVMRPYAADAIAKLARDAMTNPQPFLERQKVRVGAAPSPASVPTPPSITPPPRPTTPTPRSSSSSPGASIPSPVSAPRPLVPPSRPATPVPSQQPMRPVVVPAAPEPVAMKGPKERYSVVCYNCHVAFDAAEAEWCTCLTKDRTLICTNCLTCFCKAPPAFKEKFFVDAPAGLLDRKTADLRRQMTGLSPNPSPDKVRRPLVMLVEDDEDIQLIVQRVCTNLGYGFIYATNGQDGLNLARSYKPNLILSDAFMPKLDGREMVRILKDENSLPETKMVVMTGLYTDTKYKNEALMRFHVDEYLSKPVQITDLINLLQKNLEGLTGTPPQEDLHEIHRRGVEEATRNAAVEDAEAGEGPGPSEAGPSGPAPTKYEVACFTCGKVFDALSAEWCRDPGREQTLICPHCSNCFCKAPAAYKERFWMDAPSSLFERKTISSKRNVSKSNNPSPMEATRPLILLVEDDEDVQLIVRTVVTTMGYGFIAAANGQEGLAMAREYNPDLILSDAFMPKLDGREMCRLLKEDPATARIKAIIMTGLYTDRKYRSEALTRFKVDDYVAKPVAVDDLIKLVKKHLPQDVQQTM